MIMGVPSRRATGKVQSPPVSGDFSPQHQVVRRRRLFPWLTSVMIVLMWALTGYTLFNFSADDSEMDRRALSMTTVAKPKYTEELISTWDFSPDDTVVQVIQTRFMQFQPNLISLGEARLKVFEVICLPSIVSQSSQSFLWVIRVDPQLHQSLRDELISLVRAYPNIVLVGSNANPEGFRLEASVDDLTPSNVWSGSYELLRRYHQAAQSRILIESRLDADDGVNRRFVEYTQMLVQKELVESSHQSDWMIICAFNHVDWHYDNPFHKPMVNVEAGFIVGVRETACITPGLSFVYGLGVSRQDMPVGSHMALTKTTDECTEDVRTKCIRKTRELSPGAIRARTPTSAGMLNVVTSGSKTRPNFRYVPRESDAEVQSRIWTGVELTFGVVQARVKALRHHLQAHLPQIVDDNIKGQCTKGHSCKATTKKVLKELLKKGQS